MRHSVKPNRVDLQSESKSGLRDATSVFKFVGEGLEVRDHVGIDLGHEPGHHPSEKDSSEAWRRFAGKVTRAQGNPPGGRVRTRTEDLEFSHRHHGARVSPCLPGDPVGQGQGSIVCPHDRRAP